MATPEEERRAFQIAQMRKRMRSNARGNSPEDIRLQEVGNSLDILDTVISAALRIPPTSITVETEEVTELTPSGVEEQTEIKVGKLVSSLLTMQTGAAIGNALQEVAAHHNDFRDLTDIIKDDKKRTQLLSSPEIIELAAYRAGSVGDYLTKHQDIVANLISTNTGFDGEVVKSDVISLVSNILYTVADQGEVLAGPVSQILNETVLRVNHDEAIDTSKVMEAGVQAANILDLRAIFSRYNIVHIHNSITEMYRANDEMRVVLKEQVGLSDAAALEQALQSIDNTLHLVAQHQDKLLSMAPAIIALAAAPASADVPDFLELEILPQIAPQLIDIAAGLVQAIDENPLIIDNVTNIINAVVPPGPMPNFAAQLKHTFHPSQIKERAEKMRRHEQTVEAQLKVEESLATLTIKQEALDKARVILAEQKADLDDELGKEPIARSVQNFKDRLQSLEKEVQGYESDPILDAVESDIVARHSVAERAQKIEQLAAMRNGVLAEAKDKEPYSVERRTQRVLDLEKKIAANVGKVSALENEVIQAQSVHRAAQGNAQKVADEEQQWLVSQETIRADKVKELQREHEAKITAAENATLPEILGNVKAIITNDGIRSVLTKNADSLGAIVVPILKRLPQLSNIRSPDAIRRGDKAFNPKAIDSFALLVAGSLEVAAGSPELLDHVQTMIDAGAIDQSKMANNQKEAHEAKSAAALQGILATGKKILENSKVQKSLAEQPGDIVEVIAQFIPKKGLVTQKMIQESAPALGNVIKGIISDPSVVDTVSNAIKKGSIGSYRDILRNKALNMAVKGNAEELAEFTAKIFEKGRDMSKLTPVQQAKTRQSDATKVTNVLKAIADLHQPTWNPFKKMVRFSRVVYNAVRLQGSIRKLVSHIKRENEKGRDTQDMPIAKLQPMQSGKQVQQKQRVQKRVKHVTQYKSHRSYTERVVASQQQSKKSSGIVR